MNTFRKYTTLLDEAKFRELPQQIVDQVNKLAAKYISHYNSNNVDLNDLLQKGKIVSFKDNKDYRTYFKHFQIKRMPSYFTPSTNLLGRVVVKDLQTNKKKKIDVYCVYGDIGDVDYAAYAITYETINLYDNNIKDLSEQSIRAKLLHEVTHSFQEYKDFSAKYAAAVDKHGSTDAETYYGEPIEIDTHLNEIVFTITNRYNQLVNAIKQSKEPASKQLLQRRLDYLLKELKVFTQAPLETYFDLEELPLPSFAETLETFLETISSDEKLKNKFKLKMVDLYSRLSGKSL